MIGTSGRTSRRGDGDIGAELACAKMIVEHCNVDPGEGRYCIFNRAGGDDIVALLAEDDCAEEK